MFENVKNHEGPSVSLRMPKNLEGRLCFFFENALDSRRDLVQESWGRLVDFFRIIEDPSVSLRMPKNLEDHLYFF